MNCRQGKKLPADNTILRTAPDANFMPSRHQAQNENVKKVNFCGFYWLLLKFFLF